MKVFACRNQQQYGGGLVLVSANTKEEAYLTAAMDDKLSYLFDWVDDDDTWCKPDGNINHCTSYSYPLYEWFEMKYLSTDFAEPKVIIEDHYTE